MSAQHTPGPWTRDGFGFLVGSTGEQVLLADSGLGFASGTNHPERYANARLAAAAPKLLKALQSIVASLAEHDDEGMIEHAEQMIAARAVIAEATGEQP